METINFPTTEITIKNIPVKDAEKIKILIHDYFAGKTAPYGQCIKCGRFFAKQKIDQYFCSKECKEKAKSLRKGENNNG